MTARRSTPPAAAVVGAHVVVDIRVAAVWAPVMSKALRDARSRGDRVEPQVIEVAEAFAEAAAFVSETKRAKQGPSPALSTPSLTVNQVAAQSGLTPQGVRLAARTGRLPGRRVGRNWDFERGDVEQWIEQRAAR